MTVRAWALIGASLSGLLLGSAACGGGHPAAARPTGSTAAGSASQATSSGSGQVSSIALAPQAVTLKNPATQGGKGTRARIKVSLTLTDQAGRRITAGRLATPVAIQVYGPSPAVLTAETPLIRSGSSAVYFDYTGGYLANPIMVSAVSGHTFAQMSFQPQHRNFPGSASVTFPMSHRDNIAHGWGMSASIGGGPQHFVEIDTGSRGLVVPASVIGKGAVGPGPAGQITYSSDGKQFLGHYYLTSLTLSAGGAVVKTVPIRVLGVDKSACAPGYPKCRAGGIQGLGVMGVGFGRGQASSTPPELSNAFLALTGLAAGSMHPGYIIRKSSLTLGITAGDAAGFNQVSLTAGGRTGPGDWSTEHGCFSFPRLTGYAPKCGTVLVDTGIASAILGLPQSQRPASLRSSIPDGTAVRVDIGAGAAPALSYRFTTGASSQPLTPTSLRWAGDAKPFVNTGRHPIAGYDYLFDDGAGKVGFKPA